MKLEEPSPPKESDQHFKNRSYAWILAVVLTPVLSVLGSYFTAYYTADAASTAASTELAKLAVQVLQSDSTNDSLNKWALQALETYTGISIPEPLTQSAVGDIKANGVAGGKASSVPEVRALTQQFCVQSGAC